MRKRKVLGNHRCCMAVSIHSYLECVLTGIFHKIRIVERLRRSN